MIFFLENWKALAVAALAAAALLFCSLWRGEVRQFSEYRAVVVAEGKAAEKEATRLNDLHDHNLEVVSNAWKDQIQPARDGAVLAYASHALRLREQSGGSSLRGRPEGDKANDGAGQEQVAPVETCRSDAQFIKDAAEDALTLGEWQDLARLNGWKAR